MKDYIIKILILTAILYYAGAVGYTIKANEPVIEPVGDYFWIDNNKYMRDSLVNPIPLYNDSGEIIGANVRIKNIEGVIFQEFLDSDDMTWKENLDSWIMAWKEEDLK